MQTVRETSMTTYKKNGFTLIELITSVAVFGFITAIVAGLFIYAVVIQRSILAQQKLLDEASFAMEYISRGLKVAERNNTGSGVCDPDPILDGRSYRLTHENPFGSGIWQGIKFQAPNPVVEGALFCREFFFDATSGRLQELRDGVQNFITSDQMEVTAFRVMLTGDDPGDSLQPRVTILLELRRRGAKPEEQPTLRLQTTVSQRNLDI